MKDYPKRLVNRNSTHINAPSFDRTTGCDVDSKFVVVANYDRKAEHIETISFQNNYIGAHEAANYVLEFKSEYVVMESTASYHILFYEVFKQKGLRVETINPTQIAQLLKIEGKNDKGDAMAIARLAASFKLKSSNMPSVLMKELRLHYRTLDKIKAQRTQTTNRINNLLTQFGVNVFRKTRANTKSGIAIVEGLVDGKAKEDILLECWFGRPNRLEEIADALGDSDSLPAFVKPFLNDLLEDLIHYNNKIESKEKQILDLIPQKNLSELVNLMTTAPIITEVLATRIIAEMGEDFTIRFSSAKAFVKAIGVCPNNMVSGGKVLKKGASHGNKHLKSALLNSTKSFCNRSIIEGDKGFDLKQYFLRVRGNSNYKKAVSATARKLMEQVYHMVLFNEEYNPKKSAQRRNVKTYKINHRKLEEV